MEDKQIISIGLPYAMQITNFSFCAGAALAQANAILTCWRMGQENMICVTRKPKRQQSLQWQQR